MSSRLACHQPPWSVHLVVPASLLAIRADVLLVSRAGVDVALLDVVGVATEGAPVGDPGAATGALPRGDNRVEGLRRGGRHPKEGLDARNIVGAGVEL